MCFVQRATGVWREEWLILNKMDWMSSKNNWYLILTKSAAQRKTVKKNTSSKSGRPCVVKESTTEPGSGRGTITHSSSLCMRTHACFWVELTAGMGCRKKLVMVSCCLMITCLALKGRVRWELSSFLEVNRDWTLLLHVSNHKSNLFVSYWKVMLSVVLFPSLNLRLTLCCSVTSTINSPVTLCSSRMQTSLAAVWILLTIHNALLSLWKYATRLCSKGVYYIAL